MVAAQDSAIAVALTELGYKVTRPRGAVGHPGLAGRRQAEVRDVVLKVTARR